MSAEWLTTNQVADRTHRHPVTVRRAAEEGRLHGHQTGRRGRWSFRPTAVDAYVTGQDSAAACGCRHLQPVRARRSA